MSWNDTDYFRRRAVAERTMERTSADPRAAEVHRELAERYEALVREAKRPALHLVVPGRLPRAA